MKIPISIVKKSGDIVAFDVEKLTNSLRRASAGENVIQQIVGEVQSTIYEGMTTTKIYKIAFDLLKKYSRVSASKYKLKNALFELGPSGFPFEKLVGKLMAHEGFSTQVGVIVQGNCVSHEIDVIAAKDDQHCFIECKFHSDQGRFCNVKSPLYVNSRFLDVEKQWKKQKSNEGKISKGGVYTNTRFTSDATQYGKCAGLLMASWDYPFGNGLKERIDKSGLHPLTALTTLTKNEKTKLLDLGVVLCREIYENPGVLNQIGISKPRHKNIIKDAKELCSLH